MLMVQCEFDTLMFEEEKKALKEMWALLNMLSKEDIISCQSTCRNCYLRHENVQLLCVCAVGLKYLKALCPISIAQ